MAFLDPVKIATHLKRIWSDDLGVKIFTADFELTFVKSLAVPEKPWATITKITDIIMPISLGTKTKPSKLKT